MDLLALTARLTLDKSQYEQGLSEAESEASSAGGRFGKIMGGIGKTVGTVAKIGAAGISAGSAVVGALTKQSVDAYSNYEQLSGGVQKLFGDAYGTVMNFASEAYKTSGVSANAYMEQVTSFSAALINSLGGDTEKAANYADVAMRAMSDNANTFGTDIQSIQYAYQGFAKQNYTMLDNLKLGYGGTKTEMERLVQDAEAMNTGFKAQRDEAGNLTLAFSDVIQAIELIQEKQNIAGTTSKEAASTIEGSFGSVRAAWENLVAGFANPDADLDKLMDNFIVAVVGEKDGEGLLNRMIPTIERALQGVGDFIAKAAPIISQRLPALMSAILPPLIKAATSLVAGLVKALPTILQMIIEQVPMIVSMLAQAFRETAPLLVELGKNLMTSIYNGLVNAFPQLKGALDTVIEIFKTAFDGIATAIDFVKEHIDTIAPIVAAVVGVITGLGILSVISGIVGAITGIATAIGGVISALSMIQSFAGLISVITTLAGGPLVLIVAAIGAVAGAFIYLWNTSEEFRNFWIGLWEGIKETVSTVWEAITGFVSAAWETIKTVVETGFQILSSIITTATTLLTLPWQFIWENFGGIITDAWNAITSFIKNALSTISNVISNVWNTISRVISGVVNTIYGNVSRVWNTISGYISNVMGTISRTFSNVWNNISSVISRVVDSIRSAIVDKVDDAKSTVSSILDGVRDKFESIFNGIKNFISPIVDWLADAFNFHWELPDVKLPHFHINWADYGPISIPEVSVEWYRKAYENPWMFTKPTTLGAFGFGDGPGGEIVYGHENLMQDIRSAMGENTERHLADIASMLEKYLPVLAKMQIFLDSGKLVGAMTAEIDAGMGVIAARKRRGN